MNIDWHKVHDWVDNFVDGGWRKTFFWVSISSMGVALVNVYVLGSIAHEYAPAEYLAKLNETLIIVSGLAGLRAIEKDRIRKHEAANGS